MASDDKQQSKNIKLEGGVEKSDVKETRLDQAPDATEIRNADKAQIQSALELNQDNWRSQDGHFAITDGHGETLAKQKPDRQVEPKSESKEDIADTSTLTAIRNDNSIPHERRFLASQFQEMREASKAHGVPTDLIDQLAGSELAREIRAKRSSSDKAGIEEGGTFNAIQFANIDSNSSVPSLPGAGPEASPQVGDREVNDKGLPTDSLAFMSLTGTLEHKKTVAPEAKITEVKPLDKPTSSITPVVLPNPKVEIGPKKEQTDHKKSAPIEASPAPHKTKPHYLPNVHGHTSPPEIHKPQGCILPAPIEPKPHEYIPIPHGPDEPEHIPYPDHEQYHEHIPIPDKPDSGCVLPAPTIEDFKHKPGVYQNKPNDGDNSDDNDGDDNTTQGAEAGVMAGGAGGGPPPPGGDKPPHYNWDPDYGTVENFAKAHLVNPTSTDKIENKKEEGKDDQDEKDKPKETESHQIIISSEYEGMVYYSKEDDRYLSAAEVARNLGHGTRADVVNKMTEEQLKEKGLERIPINKADAELKEKLDKIVESDLKFDEDGKITKESGLAITDEIREELRTFCPEINNRNIAFAIVEVDGRKHILVAINGADGLAPGLAPPAKGDVFEIPENEAFPRLNDTEHKLLELTVHLFKAAESIRVTMFTEQTPCEDSCKSLIENQVPMKFGSRMTVKYSSAYETQALRLRDVKKRVEARKDKGNAE